MEAYAQKLISIEVPVIATSRIFFFDLMFETESDVLDFHLRRQMQVGKRGSQFAVKRLKKNKAERSYAYNTGPLKCSRSLLVRVFDPLRVSVEWITHAPRRLQALRMNGLPRGSVCRI
jgi:hypothetical protein